MNGITDLMFENANEIIDLMFEALVNKANYTYPVKIEYLEWAEGESSAWVAEIMKGNSVLSILEGRTDKDGNTLVSPCLRPNYS